MKKIGVLTSGGDAPGMNPCIRAIVRFALSQGVEVVGIEEGFRGLINGEMERLTARSVGGILQRGGTILQTARSKKFRTVEGQRDAVRQLREEEIEGLLVIGGDGSLRGAMALVDQGIPVIGIPASIDNDIWGTNMSIGVDTALNTIRVAIDQLRDTASSHNRAFLIETMGRGSGYLALIAGVIGGAEMVLIPEIEVDIDEVAEAIDNSYRRGKTHSIIVVAEGASIGVNELSQKLKERNIGFATRITLLGHIQRGGSPTAFDRLLAIRMGVKAVQALIDGESNVMVGLTGREVSLVPLKEVTENKRVANLEYFEMIKTLAV